MISAAVFFSRGFFCSLLLLTKYFLEKMFVLKNAVNIVIFVEITTTIGEFYLQRILAYFLPHVPELLEAKECGMDCNKNP